MSYVTLMNIRVVKLRCAASNIMVHLQPQAKSKGQRFDTLEFGTASLTNIVVQFDFGEHVRNLSKPIRPAETTRMYCGQVASLLSKLNSCGAIK
jgi:hypothetical protein